MDPIAEKILMFWFGTTDVSAEMSKNDEWFKSTDAFDNALTEQFTDIQAQAARGELDHLTETAEECLALIIALDQFSRNVFRNSPKAFDADPKARDIARLAMGRNYHEQYSSWPKVFCYLPFEHSEILEDHDFIEPYYMALEGAEFEHSKQMTLDHSEAIRRFGRYPHRNAVMGRENTPEEEEYLKDPPLWGKTKAEAEEIMRQKAEREAAERS